MTSTEVKHFFKENNQVNKIGPEFRDAPMYKVKNRFEEMLPPPEVLHAYEEIMPGAVEKLIALVEEEQRHHHAMEKAKVFMHSKTETIGKLFAAFILLGMAYVTIVIANKSLNHAIMFAAISFLGLVGVSVFGHFSIPSRFPSANNAPSEQKTIAEKSSSKPQGASPASNRTRSRPSRSRYRGSGSSSEK